MKYCKNILILCTKAKEESKREKGHQWGQQLAAAHSLAYAELALVFRVERLLGDALLSWGCISDSLMQSWSLSLDIARLYIFSLFYF